FTLYGLGSRERYYLTPDQQFLSTDFKDITLDALHYVIDTESQLPPHLMPPPLLCDASLQPFNPQPSSLQPPVEMAPIARESVTDFGPLDSEEEVVSKEVRQREIYLQAVKRARHEALLARRRTKYGSAVGSRIAVPGAEPSQLTFVDLTHVDD